MAPLIKHRPKKYKATVLVTATTFPRWKEDTEPGFVYELSDRLAKYGYKLIVLAPHHNGASLRETIGNLDVRRYPYFSPRSLQKLCYEGGILPNLKKSHLAKLQVPLLLTSQFLAMRRVIKHEKVDFVHAHWAIPQGYLASLIKRTLNVPYIVTAHAGDVFPIRNSLLRSFGRAAIEGAFVCTANSNYTKDKLLSIAQDPRIKPQIIPMGVDVSHFRKKIPAKSLMAIRKRYGLSGKVILSVGRLAEKKGLAYLIEAMPIILRHFKDAKLLIVGDGPERSNLELQSKRLGLGSCVVFIGKVRNSDLPMYYQTSDVFVLPSIVTRNGDTEGLGVVLLEAIAAGTPAVASDVGGIPDIILDGKTGLLSEEKNPADLADKILKILDNPSLSRTLVANGQRHISKSYAWSIVARKFAKIYARLVRKIVREGARQ